MSVSHLAPSIIPEKEGHGGIHLVSMAVPASAHAWPKLPSFKPISNTPRRGASIQTSERMSMLALAGAAMIAPAIWMTHAVLVWLDVL